jgi:phosphoesterase RecJ-like protein
MGLSIIASAIEKARTIMLVAHIQPDGDTLGSSFALKVMLEKMGKDVFICCDGDMPSRYQELFPVGELISPANVSGAADLAISVDCADAARLGKS